MSVLTYFDVYVSQGLKVIPLKNNSKAPISKNWNKYWNSDQIRNVVADFGYNIGILLGGIIDVEGDTPQANKLLMGLTKNCSHPMYESSKSVHHFFINPDPTITIIKYQGIEFRGGKHHSVLPPSKHPDGTEYSWLEGSRFPIPKMPYSLLSLLKKAKKYQKDNIKPNHFALCCADCHHQSFLHKKRFSLEMEAFKLLGEKWICRSCRKIDVRGTCREIRRKNELNRVPNLWE